MANSNTDQAPSDSERNPNAMMKEVQVDGYNFTVDTDLIDDVETLEIIDRIENKNQIGAIIGLLEMLVGKQGYADMKAHFIKQYGKFRATKLADVYMAIMAAYDPKG